MRYDSDVAFKFSELSSLVQTDPTLAHAKLKELFDSHGGNANAVAGALAVSRATVFRWLKRLTAAGHVDPRGDQRGTPGRKKGK
jgi:predicted ArsR family transcriptional regulator